MSRLLRPISLVTVIAQFVFVLSWLVAAAWQGPSYSVLAHSISDMYAVSAPHGEVLVVVFTITGAITIMFAVAIWHALRNAGWTALLGAILLGFSIFGLGDLLSAFERLACRLADPGCTADSQLANAGGQLDAALSTAGIGLFIAALIFLSFAMQDTEGWRRWVWPTRSVAIAEFLLFIADGALASVGLGGLLERLVAALGAFAIAGLAVVILRDRSSSATRPSVVES
jgi:hypothetical protein